MEHYKHFEHWFAKLINRCITFGRHIYFNTSMDLIPNSLINHELKHVEQYQRYVIFEWQWIAIFRYLLIYLWQWFSVGFRHSKIPFEIEARKAE